LMRYDIINQFIRERNYTSFLEIGTNHGETYTRITTPIRISVDPEPKSPATFRMTSDDFFAMNENLHMTFDIVFIDGLHTCDQAYRDINNALAILNPDGVIIVHDCLPTNEIMQTPADSYPGGVWTGDVWKAFVKARSESPYLTYTIDQDFGCGIIDTTVKRKKPKLPSDMSAMTYEQYRMNRDRWLNVKGEIVNANE